MVLGLKMGGDITYSRRSLSIPNRDYLRDEFVLGGSEALSIKNRGGIGKASMVPIGEPVYGPGYVTVSDAGSGTGFNSNVVAPLSDITIMAVVQLVSGCPPFFAKNSQNLGFLNNGSAPLLYGAQSGTAGSVANLPAPTHGDFAFYFGRIPLGGYAEIGIFEDGVATTNTAENPGSATRNSNPFQIGGDLSNGGSGTANMAWISVFDGLRSDEFIETTYLGQKEYQALDRGNTVS